MREPAPRRGLLLCRRLLWLGAALAAAAVLLLAARLTPDPLGHGTHTQLGLPPCGFRWLTDLPCPACGMTTAFAHGIRGNLVRSAVANPVGFVLFVLACLLVPFGLWAALRGWSLDVLIDRFSLHHWALLLAGSACLVWLGRIAAAL